MAVNPGNAKPFYGNGHYYLFTQESATWTQALDRSDDVRINNEAGYLATITSQSENDFIKNYSYNGSATPDGGFIAGTDDHKNYSSSLGISADGQWVWAAGPESGTQFWSGGRSGSAVNSSYTRWNSGQPDNDGNQDYLQFYTNGYWYDNDPKDNLGGYITEWGKAGAEYNLSLAPLNSSNNQNGTEGEKSPSMILSLDRFISADYTNYPGTTPLVDIPISFSGTAILDKDYTLKLSDRNGTSAKNSYYSNGRLYLLDTDQVTLTFEPKDNSTWEPLRTIQVSLSPDGSENIYAFNGNSSSQVWLFDNEPQLSLGQGAWQYIRAPYTEGNNGSLPNVNTLFIENDDVLIIDTDGINENDGSFSKLGLYNSFATRWETYLRIPETGNYAFKAIADDGVKMTAQRNNSTGAELASISQWKDQGATQYSTPTLSLSKGDVIWVRFDYYENGGAATAQLLWDRPGTTGEPVPASAMFLSEALAKGTNQQEPLDSDSFETGFQVFANKRSEEVNLQLTSSSETSNSTYGTYAAQRQLDSTKVGNDYRLETPNTSDPGVAGTPIAPSEIGVNGSYGTLGWTPNQANFSEANIKTINLAVLPDTYAENSESVTLTLKEAPGYGVSNDGVTDSTISQTALIDDNPFVLSIGTEVVNTTEGDWGWVTFNTGGRPAPESGMRVLYEITGGTASLGLQGDYLAPQATLSTTSFEPQNYVILAPNATEGKIYISALADAIKEEDETVIITLKSDKQTDSEDFTYQQYNIGTAKTATLTIRDSGLYQPAVVITPKGRTGLATIRSLVNQTGLQEATFDLQLASQPQAQVSVQLSTSSSSGTLSPSSILLTPDNWNQPQSITLTGQSNQEITIVTASSSSDDPFYDELTTKQTIVPSSWPDNLILSLWEGGVSNPVLPVVSVTATDGNEDANSRLGFTFNLSTALTSDLKIRYSLNGGAGFRLSGAQADVKQAPIQQPDGTYAIRIPAGGTSASINLVPRDDQINEGNEQISAALISSELYTFGSSTGSATANLIDDDSASVIFSVATDPKINTDSSWIASNHVRTTESGDPDSNNNSTVGISLGSQPTSDVTLQLNHNSIPTDELLINGSTEPLSLTFTAENWRTPQAVQIQAVNEDEDDGDQNFLVSFTISSDDPNYASLAPGLSVLVVDDDATSSDAAPIDGNTNVNDPLATLSGPTLSQVSESSSSRSQYTISLSEATDIDRVIYVDLDHHVTTADHLDFTLGGDDADTSATGLTVFSANANANEQASIDFDAIQEDIETFAALGLTGDFTATWSGYLYIPESGFYIFGTDLQGGGARLSIGDVVIIDKLFDNDESWQSDAIQLSGGDFIAVKLDYQSCNAPDPSIELSWIRPNSRSDTGFSEEAISASNFSRVNGHHLIIPAGSRSATFSVISNDDSIKEDDKSIGFKLLSPRGVEILVTSQSIGEQENTRLGLQLTTTDREAITLPVGTALKLGADTQNESNTIATFTLTEAATIHRDRSASVNGVLNFVDSQSGTDSVIGLVGADNSAQYQLLDPAVEISLVSELKLTAEATENAAGQYTTSIQLAETNRSELLLPTGSELDFQLPTVDIGITLTSGLEEVDAQTSTYKVDLVRSDTDPTDVVLPAGFSFDFTTEESGQTFTLIIPSNLELAAGANISDLNVEISAIADGLKIGDIEPGLNSEAQLTRVFSLRLNDDLSISSGNTVTDVAVSAFNSTNGLDLTALDSGLSSSYVIPNTALVTIKDDEQAGLLFSTDSDGETVIDHSDAIQIREDGAGETRYVKLTSQPTNSVTLYLETSDSSEALLQMVSSGTQQAAAKSRIALTFSPDNWNTSQAFSIVPIDDKTIDGTIDLGIYSRTNSSDPFYQESRTNNLSAPQKSLAISVADNDQARVLIELQQSSLNEAENGFLNFSLTAEPSADVVLTLVPSDHQFSLNGRGIGQVETITFTPDNWQAIQTLELHAVDDVTVEDVTSSDLAISSASEDSAFAGLIIDPIRVDVIDNDLPTASIIPVTESSEEAAPGRFRIELSNSAPSSAGSSGVVVNYEITSVTLDSDKLGYPSEPDSINKVTQSPGVITGQVRIAPGQSSSDVFVVPIDDFVADSFDKSFTVSLVEGVDYVLDQQSSTNQATVHIINNDVAGIVILLSGDTLRVSESGDPGEFNIALLSQPGSDVKLTLSEQQLNGVRQLGSTYGTAYSQTLTFTPDNWFIAQRASVRAYDDFIIEDKSTTGDLIIFKADGKPIGGTPLYSGLHPTQLQYIFESDDSDYDSLGRTLSNNLIIDQISSTGQANLYEATLKQTTGESPEETFSAGSVLTAIDNKTNEKLLITLQDAATLSAGVNNSTKIRFSTPAEAALAETSLTPTNSANSFTHTLQSVDVLDIELPAETADSLQNALTNLQEGIDSLALPMVGSLDGKTGGGLRKFITSLANSIRAIGTPTPAKLSQLISEAINGAIGKEVADVSLSMNGTEAIDVGFRFSDKYEVASIPLDAEFGLPGLGLQSQGSIDADFSYDANLAFSFPREGDPVLITTPSDSEEPDKTEYTNLNANFTTSLSPDFELTGGLGFLQLDAVNQESPNEEVQIGGEPASTEMQVNFELDLAGSNGAGADGSLSFDELTSPDTKLEDLFQYRIVGDAAVSLGVTTSVNGSAAIPSFSFDLSSLLPLFDYSNIEEAEDQKNSATVFFDNIQLDLGSYITQMLDPIVGGIDDIINPLYPIVDALYADTQIFNTIKLTKTFDNDKDGKVSAIDLAEWFADIYAFIDPVKGGDLKKTIDATIEFLDTVKGVMDLIEDLKAMSEEGDFYIDFGSYTLSDFRVGDAEETTPKVSDPEDGTPAADDTRSDTRELSTDTGEQADAGAGSSSFADIMEQLDELGFQIPLIDDPKNAIDLLLGNPVDLFTWTMPSMGMESEIEESFPIYSGVDGIIEGGFGVDARIGFGFDTSGLQEWMDSGFVADDFWKVFNGFYVNDRDADGNDVPEFTLNASMGAGLGLTALVVKSSITGGLEAEASLDLMDEGEIAGTDDGKIYGDEIISRLDNPLDLFELVGSLAAYLKAKVQVGIDMGFYSTWDTVWEDKLAEIPIFEFGVGGSYGSGTASNGYLNGSTVFFDANSNGRIDQLEPSTIVGEDSHYNLRIDQRTFDIDRNGIIDASEGRLMVFGGTDSTTGLPLEIPMLAPLGQMITPFTTLHALGLDLGYSEAEVRDQIDSLFKLGGFDYLTNDPLLGIKQAEKIDDATIQDDLATYVGHIKLMTGLTIFTNTLEQVDPKRGNTLKGQLSSLTAFTDTLLDQSILTSDEDKAISSALLAIANSPFSNLSENEISLVRQVSEFASDASAEFNARVNELLRTHQSDASSSTTTEALAALHSLKQEVLSSYQSNTSRLSEGLYRIAGNEAQLNELSSRLTAAHGDFIQLTKPQPAPSDSTAKEAAQPQSSDSTEPPAISADPAPVLSTSSLTPISIRTLTPNEINLFSADDVAGIPPDAIAALSRSQITALRPDAMQGFSASQIQALSPTAIASFRRAQLRELTPKAIAGLTAQQAAELKPRQVAAFTANQIAQLQKSTFKQLSVQDLRQLKPDTITGLTLEHVRSLSKNELEAFESSQIKAIQADVITGINPRKLNRLDPDLIQAFSRKQISELSQRQIRKGQVFIENLSSKQFEALSSLSQPEPGNALLADNPLASNESGFGSFLLS